MRNTAVGRWFEIGAAIVLLVMVVSTGAAQADKFMQAEAERIVSQYKTVMEQPPRRVPSRDTVDGPLLGNGDLGAVISGNPEAQRFWISKNNFWRLVDGHRTGGPRLFGSVEFSIPALAGATYRAEQDFYPATTTSRFTKGETNVTMRSWIAATADLLIVELSVTGGSVDVETKLWAAPGRGSVEELGSKDGMPWATKAFLNNTGSLSAIPELSGKTPDVTLTAKQINYPRTMTAWPGLPVSAVDHFVARHTGQIRVDRAGDYTFYLNSDDGSKMWLDDVLLINHDGRHSMREASASVSLESGHHSIRVEFFDDGSEAGLVLSWAGPGIEQQVVPASVFSQKGGTAGLLAEFFTEEWRGVPKNPTSAACAVKLLGASEPTFKLKPGQKVTVALAMQSSFDTDNPLAAAQKMADEVEAEAIDKLLVAHRKWWAEFWAESLVEISDPFLEQNYYAANYCVGSALRDPEFPTGLYGLWVTSDDPRWAGDYHLNFDYQSQFYGLYQCNHLVQAATYHAPILDFMERGRWYAKNLLDVRGVYYCVGIGAKGIDTCKMGNRTDSAFQAGGCFMGQKCNAVYSVIPMSMHWYYTYDKEYGGTVYPFVLEVANFWEDYLRFEPFDANGRAREVTPCADSAVLPTVASIDGVPVDKIPASQLPPGRYVIYNDSIQECSGADVNSIMSLGLVRNAFETALDMSKELDMDADRREKWQHILNYLSDFPTFEKDGKTVFRYTEKGTEWINGNSCGLQHIYPSGAIGLDSDPKLLEIGRNTISAEGRKWSGDNGENSMYPAAVRVGYDPATIL
ncbi:MAG: hypothetical protein K9N51_13670, partial [Candidatus Pacebacteria bacterium]|nr:hypothetical protein [Candidatus Paceibacterota bacterium]